MKYVDVALDLPYPAGKQLYTYVLPSAFDAMDVTGCRVKVPFGVRSRLKVGFVVSVKNTVETEFKLKYVHSIIDTEPIISQELLTLGQWLAQRTISTLWTVFNAMLPSYIKLNMAYIVIKLNTKNEEALEHVSEFSQQLYMQLPEEYLLSKLLESNDRNLSAIKELEKAALISFKLKVQHKGREQKETVYFSTLKEVDDLEEPDIKNLLARAYKQKELLLHLIVDGSQTVEELKKYFKNPKPLLNKLEEKGLIEKKDSVVLREPYLYNTFFDDRTFFLTREQQKVFKNILEKIQSGSYHSFLLFGVTGSGKTEIYMRAAQQVIAEGKQVLLLVPEISLTSQLIGRFESKFQGQVAIIHSQLSDGERYDQWCEIKKGNKNIVIGVRSAVFAPLNNIGLIIVDEAHEGSYKQSEPEPRYHARLVAEKRAQANNAVFIAGSATPAIELYYRANNKSMTLLELQKRANNSQLPKVNIIDMREELRQGNRQIFSNQLIESLQQTVDRGEQAILFLNRRGYATFIMCRECGHVINCKQCDIAMTYYRQKNVLRCHYCNKIETIPQYCPNCGSESIRYFGSGTELVTQSFSELFPQVSYIRLDSDAARKKHAHQKILSDFKSGNAQVLIGTQMAGKGLDFPNVTLVGVISADVTLHMPDYRASERTFQQLTQVAGRAGRGEKEGIVIIQTYMPDHPAIVAASQHDFEMFYFHEIAVRRQLNYPPYVHLLRIVVSSEIENIPRIFLEQLTIKIKQSKPENIDLLGPSPTPIERIRKRYRYQLIAKSISLKQLLYLGDWCRTQASTSRNSKSLRLTVDIDPENIL